MSSWVHGLMGPLANMSPEHFSISGQDLSNQKKLLWKFLGSTIVRKKGSTQKVLSNGVVDIPGNPVFGCFMENVDLSRGGHASTGALARALHTVESKTIFEISYTLETTESSKDVRRP